MRPLGHVSTPSFRFAARSPLRRSRTRVGQPHADPRRSGSRDPRRIWSPAMCVRAAGFAREVVSAGGGESPRLPAPPPADRRGPEWRRTGAVPDPSRAASSCRESKSRRPWVGPPVGRAAVGWAARGLGRSRVAPDAGRDDRQMRIADRGLRRIRIAGRSGMWVADRGSRGMSFAGCGSRGMRGAGYESRQMLVAPDAGSPVAKYRGRRVAPDAFAVDVGSAGRHGRCRTGDRRRQRSHRSDRSSRAGPCQRLP